MRNIRLQEMTKSQGEGLILNKVNLAIPSGQFFALLGPSGCGKTTLLRLIAGFEKPDSGIIYLGNTNITDLPVNKRPINIVFQNYALFPHLNVFNNVAYSLVIQKIPKEEIEQRVIKILKTFHLENHIFKLPAQLSGGQQQRVALARAIINEPEVLLLDEPLAALDFKLREKMLVELIDLQDKLKTTFIYVTHDQFEALTVADQMAIMNHDGEIEQIGTPKEIYEFPVSSFVARFVGTTNILSGTLHNIETSPEVEVPHMGTFKVYIPQKKLTPRQFLGDEGQAKQSQISLNDKSHSQSAMGEKERKSGEAAAADRPQKLSRSEQNKTWMGEGCSATLSIRPEKIFISKKPVENFTNTLKGVVSQIVYHGRSTQYNVIINNQFKIQVFEQNEEHFAQEDIDYDDEVYLYWQKENALLLES
ncbi:ATP-binding cassette domain-containing protein [Candidatus Neptunochlamydia vexilliferae]|uniref:Spermidine/putrescine import ATP-binding protein PotA n=1 Tax=Candidatus Neptunichlamydia vexilliferae TaxID=1651774 RepID=A0ABS0AZP6_9BACT|nr:ABC transporter ATP-binding protein [Candidatus Neptunochlamydia vexilliferae]MBF5059608.1 Spermidine/putrescine import ATP-binding protein PotA [Candidatus Neptunochlamydia vexilliferae]